MLQLEYDKQQMEEVIDKIVRKTMNMDLTWDWPCGVAYYGISDAYVKTQKTEYLDLLKERVEAPSSEQEPQAQGFSGLGAQPCSCRRECAV